MQPMSHAPQPLAVCYSRLERCSLDPFYSQPLVSSYRHYGLPWPWVSNGFIYVRVRVGSRGVTGLSQGLLSAIATGSVRGMKKSMLNWPKSGIECPILLYTVYYTSYESYSPPTFFSYSFLFFFFVYVEQVHCCKSALRDSSSPPSFVARTSHSFLVTICVDGGE